jgi:hypothetical protein
MNETPSGCPGAGLLFARRLAIHRLVELIGQGGHTCGRCGSSISAGRMPVAPLGETQWVVARGCSVLATLLSVGTSRSTRWAQAGFES